MMRRVFKILLISVLGILLIGVGIAWWFISDEAWLAGETEQFVSDLTGRQFSIDGSLELRLSLDPSVEAKDLRLANATWAGESDMVTVKRLAASIDLMSLFSDRLVIHYIEAHGVALALAENGEGEVNWDLLPEQDKKGAEPSVRPAQLPLVVRRLDLSGFTLSHDEPERKEPLDFRIDSLSMKQDGDGPVDMQGAGAIGGLPLSLNGRVDPLRAVLIGGPMQEELHLKLGEISLETTGTIEDALSWKGIELEFRLTGPEFAWITQQAALPEFSSGPFDFNLLLDSDDSGTMIELDGDLGTLETRVKGKVDDLREPQEAELDFEVIGPDLQSLGETFGVDRLAAAPYHFKGDLSAVTGYARIHQLTAQVGEDSGRISGALGKWPDFKNTELDIHLQGPDFSRWGPIMRIDGLLELPFEFTGRVSNLGSTVVLTTNELQVGPHRAEVAGSLGNLPDLMGAALTVDVSTPDVSSIVLLPGHGELPAKPVTLKGSVGRNSRGILLNALQLEMEGSRVVMDGLITLVEDLNGSELRTRFNTPNLGALGGLFGVEGLPQQPLQLTASYERSAAGVDFEIEDGSLGGIALALKGRVPDLDDIDGLETSFDISMPSFNAAAFLLGGREVPDLPLSLKGDLQYRDKVIAMQGVTGNLGRTSFGVDASVRHAPEVEIPQARVSVSSPDFHQLIKHEQLDRLPGQLEINGQLSYVDKVIGLQGLSGKLGDTSFDLDASVRHAPKVEVSQARVSLSSPDFHQLIAHERLDPLPGDLKIDGQLLKETEGVRIDKLAVDLGSMHAEIKGRVNALPEVSKLDLTIAFSGPDLSELSGVAKRPLPEHEFSLGGRIHGSRKDLAIDGLKASLGPSDLSGDLQLNLGESKGISGSVYSSVLDLTQLVAKAQNDEDATEDEGGSEPRQRVFSDEQILTSEEFEALIELDLAIDHFQLRGAKLQDIRIGLYQGGDIFRVDPFEMAGQRGGSIKGKFQADRTSEVPQLSLSLDAGDIPMGLAAAEDQDPATYPRWDFRVNITGEGTTEQEMASSLDGRILAVSSEGLIANAGMDLFMSDLFMELFNTLNPFAEKSQYTKLDCSVMALDVREGIVTTVVPMVFQTGEVTIISGGTIDLNSEKLDLGFNTKLRKGIGISAGMVVNPFIKVSGTLASPSIALDPTGTAVSGSIAVATVGLSLIGKSLWDRFFSTRDPCGQSLKQLEKQDAEKD